MLAPLRPQGIKDKKRKRERKDGIKPKPRDVTLHLGISLRDLSIAAISRNVARAIRSFQAWKSWRDRQRNESLGRICELHEKFLRLFAARRAGSPVIAFQTVSAFDSRGKKVSKVSRVSTPSITSLRNFQSEIDRSDNVRASSSFLQPLTIFPLR